MLWAVCSTGLLCRILSLFQRVRHAEDSLTVHLLPSVAAHTEVELALDPDKRGAAGDPRYISMSKLLSWIDVVLVISRKVDPSEESLCLVNAVVYRLWGLQLVLNLIGAISNLIRAFQISDSDLEVSVGVPDQALVLEATSDFDDPFLLLGTDESYVNVNICSGFSLSLINEFPVSPSCPKNNRGCLDVMREKFYPLHGVATSNGNASAA